MRLAGAMYRAVLHRAYAGYVFCAALGHAVRKLGELRGVRRMRIAWFHRTCFLVGVATFLGAGLTACGSSPALPTPVTPYQGNWVGTTSQGFPISFVVTANAVTSISFLYTMPLAPGDPFCTGDPVTGSATVKTPQPLAIVNLGANTGVNLPGFHSDSLSTDSIAFAISGSFGSGMASSGEVDFNSKGSGGLVGVSVCSYRGSATWATTREPS
jgi:hypothetical protein